MEGNTPHEPEAEKNGGSIKLEPTYNRGAMVKQKNGATLMKVERTLTDNEDGTSYAYCSWPQGGITKTGLFAQEMLQEFSGAPK